MVYDGNRISWHFRSIGLGTFNYRMASKRIAREADSLNLFKTSIGFNDKYLQENLTTFWVDHQKILKARFPGFGWYIWKPFFIYNLLVSLPLGDGLIYCDAGNIFDTRPESILSIKTYMKLTTEQGIVGSNSQIFVEENYSSKSLLDYLDIDLEDRKTPQFLGGFLMLINRPDVVDIVKKWCDLACQDDHNFLIPRNIDYEIDEFDSHKHDQAILSSLLKKYKKPSVIIGDKFNPGCIRAVRHRYGYKFEEKNPIIKIFYKSIYLFSKYKLATQRRIFKTYEVTRPPFHLNIEN